MLVPPQKASALSQTSNFQTLQRRKQNQVTNGVLNHINFQKPHSYTQLEKALIRYAITLLRSTPTSLLLRVARSPAN